MTGAVIRVQTENFDIGVEIDRLARAEMEVGAIVAFAGICRSDGGRLAAIELEHYPGMAEKEIERIAEEANQRWPLTGLTIIHRFGRIIPGENIVLVITASLHRDAAFLGAEFLMDFLKTRAPFWKLEYPTAKTTATWVAARTEDDASTRRWSPTEGETPSRR